MSKRRFVDILCNIYVIWVVKFLAIFQRNYSFRMRNERKESKEKGGHTEQVFTVFFVKNVRMARLEK